MGKIIAEFKIGDRTVRIVQVTPRFIVESQIKHCSFSLAANRVLVNEALQVFEQIVRRMITHSEEDGIIRDINLKGWGP